MLGKKNSQQCMRIDDVKNELDQRISKRWGKRYVRHKTSETSHAWEEQLVKNIEIKTARQEQLDKNS